MAELQPDTDAVQQPCGADAVVLPRQTRTRQGRARLLTLDHLDQRTAAAKAARNLVTHLTSDLGGDDQLSAGERELVKRAALCGAIVADFEARWVAGQPVELNRISSRGECTAACAYDVGPTAAAARCDAAVIERIPRQAARGGSRVRARIGIDRALLDCNLLGAHSATPHHGRLGCRCCELRSRCRCQLRIAPHLPRSPVAVRLPADV